MNSMAITKIYYFVNHYDEHGDLFENGIFLSIGPVSFKLCDTVDEISDVISNLENIQKEIKQDSD